jgi:threonine dehydratase
VSCRIFHVIYGFVENSYNYYNIKRERKIKNKVQRTDLKEQSSENKEQKMKIFVRDENQPNLFFELR